jgi:hypothetical protein
MGGDPTIVGIDEQWGERFTEYAGECPLSSPGRSARWANWCALGAVQT